ncbi:MAG: cell division protein FtsH [Gammaproteobacteria bacterium]|nr:cell division protein FtsH [Gammaproteobacteria bacterium]
MPNIITTSKLFSSPPIKIEKKEQPKHVPYSSFLRDVKKNDIIKAEIDPNTDVVYFEERNGTIGSSYYVPSDDFWKTMTESEVEYDILRLPNNNLSELVSFIFITVGFFALFRLVFGSSGSANPFSMSKTDIEVENEILTRFADVQGIDNAKDELGEIVDFLREPEKYFGTGAKIPKGALLTGSPGTGKTLLARAIAGESSVPFIQCSGSSFVEMFVGVGAKRVRDVFEMAKQNQPCIVFIDEIDAIGKKRSNNGFAANDEREQTINQLLVEMDGFENETGIVVIAATNRIDILDEALLRPGRFDRKIQVSLPDVHGREEILKVHCKDKTLRKDVELKNIAKQTMGFTGADLANLMNECAIRSVRDGNEGIITPDIVEDVYQRVVVGAKGSRTVSDARKARVAYHEAGHAIIGVLMKEYDEVRKVSILPRGDTGGVTYFQPATDDIGMYTKDYLLSQIKVALGGHAAEEIVYGREHVTTGASNDFEQTFKIARNMVTTYGMSETIGKMNIDPNYISPRTASHIDIEIHDIVEVCYTEVKELLNTYRVKLEHLKDILVEEEIIDGSLVYEMVASCDLKNMAESKCDTIQTYIDAYDSFDQYRDGDDIILP